MRSIKVAGTVTVSRVSSSITSLRLINCQQPEQWLWLQVTTGWSKKWHKVNDTIILQSFVIESCGFQQNVLKEILYVTKVSI